MASKKRPVIAWDSCVLIELIQGKGGRFENIMPIYNEGMQGNLSVVASTMVRAEVCPKSDEQRERVLEFLKHGWFVFRQLDVRIAARASEIVLESDSNISPGDAVHVATALSVGALALLTYDGDPKKGRTRGRKNRLLKFDQKFGGLPIVTPEEFPWMNTLFDKRGK